MIDFQNNDRTFPSFKQEIISSKKKKKKKHKSKYYESDNTNISHTSMESFEPPLSAVNVEYDQFNNLKRGKHKKSHHLNHHYSSDLNKELNMISVKDLSRTKLSTRVSHEEQGVVSDVIKKHKKKRRKSEEQFNGEFLENDTINKTELSMVNAKLYDGKHEKNNLIHNNIVTTTEKSNIKNTCDDSLKTFVNLTSSKSKEVFGDSTKKHKRKRRKSEEEQDEKFSGGNTKDETKLCILNDKFNGMKRKKHKKSLTTIEKLNTVNIGNDLLETKFLTSSSCNEQEVLNNSMNEHKMKQKTYEHQIMNNYNEEILKNSKIVKEENISPSKNIKHNPLNALNCEENNYDLLMNEMHNDDISYTSKKKHKKKRNGHEYLNNHRRNEDFQTSTCIEENMSFLTDKDFQGISNPHNCQNWYKSNQIHKMETNSVTLNSNSLANRTATQHVSISISTLHDDNETNDVHNSKKKKKHKRKTLEKDNNDVIHDLTFETVSSDIQNNSDKSLSSHKNHHRKSKKFQCSQDPFETCNKQSKNVLVCFPSNMDDISNIYNSKNKHKKRLKEDSGSNKEIHDLQSESKLELNSYVSDLFLKDGGPDINLLEYNKNNKLKPENHHSEGANKSLQNCDYSKVIDENILASSAVNDCIESFSLQQDRQSKKHKKRKKEKKLDAEMNNLNPDCDSIKTEVQTDENSNKSSCVKSSMTEQLNLFSREKDNKHSHPIDNIKERNYAARKRRFQSAVKSSCNFLDFEDDFPDFEIPPLHKNERVRDLNKVEQEKFQREGIKIKKGKFTKEEREILIQNWNNFMHRYKINDPSALFGISSQRFKNKDVQTFLRAKHFYVRLGRGLNDRTLFSIYKHARNVLDPNRDTSRFTSEEIDKLFHLHSLHGANWTYIASLMERTSKQCETIFRTHNKLPKINKNHWSKEEDKRLQNAIRTLCDSEEKIALLSSQPCGISWEKVASMVETRNSMQCRDHWMNVLASNHKPRPWNAKYKSILLYILHENLVDDETLIDWQSIYPIFKNNVVSYAALMNRFNRMKRKVPKYEKKTYIKIINHLYKYYLPELLKRCKLTLDDLQHYVTKYK